jgi:hypothetical protein
VSINIIHRLYKKNIINCLIIFSIGLLIGAIWYKFRFFPISQISHWKSNRVSIVKYTAGDPLFYDREYYDEIGNKDSVLNGLFLIKITRHRSSKDLVTIRAKYPLIIYRVLSESNVNQFLHQYKETNIKVKIVGHLSIHSSVVKKEFPAGLITLSPGKGKSSSPILISPIKGSSVSQPFEIIN